MSVLTAKQGNRPSLLDVTTQSWVFLTISLLMAVTLDSVVLDVDVHPFCHDFIVYLEFERTY